MTTDYPNPLPVPTPDTQPYWDGLKNNQINLPQCQDCNKFHHFPRAICPYCGSTNLAWETVTGAATLYSFSINHRPPRGWTSDEPPVIAIVELSEGVKLHTRMTNPPDDPTSIKIGVPVEPVFDAVTADVTLLHYKFA